MDVESKAISFGYELKGLDEERRIIRGIATTPNPDREGDIVEPLGLKFASEIPLFLYHSSEKSIGTVKLGPATPRGVAFEATLPKISEPGALRDRVDEAWQMVKYGLIKGASIGFKTIEGKVEQLKSGALRFLQAEVLELSLVPIPMNAEAVITAIKSIDSQQRAASGATTVRSALTPGATGTNLRKGNDMRTSTEHIASMEAKRAANMARMKAIEDETESSGSIVMDAAQAEEHDTLRAEVAEIDKDLVRRKATQAMMVAQAVAVTPPAPGADAAEAGSQARRGIITGMGQTSVPKSIQFTRVAMCCMRAKGDTMQALENAKTYKDTPDVEQAVKVLMHAKAAVAAGNTTDSTWAAPLVVYQNLANAFIELLRPMTILGKLTGMVQVPFNVSIPRQTAGSTSSWVGEDDPKPVSRLSLETITLGHTKIATIVVLTEELVQDSDPSAEALVQRDMLASIRAYSDAQFIDPTVSASGTIRPASITNGLTTHNMTGTAVANVLTDVQTLMGGFITANIGFEGAVWVMHPRTALYLSMLLSPLGTMQFPGLSVSGGTFMGFPVITSASVPIDTGADTYIILISAPDILMADKGLVVDVSREASLQMDSAPSDSAASMISLWQKNLVGLRAERRINYRRRRDAAVQVLSAVSY